VTLLSLSALLAGGCIAVGGSDNYTEPTLGKQLMDLKTARDTGAISPEEYERAKADLVAGKRPAHGH
jgi:hypothetical protein